MKYKLGIFDLDGTLLNSLDDIASSCNYALRENNLPEHTTDEVRFMVGNGILKLIQRAVPENSDEQTVQKVYQIFLDHYHKHCVEKTKPYNGIVECLKALKKDGLLLAVNTNKVETASIDLCNQFFPGIFDYVCGSKEGIRPKPATDGVMEILRNLNLDEHIPAVFIGDSDVDIQTGKNAGFDTIGVDWGFRGKDFLMKNGAGVVAMTLEELYKIIAE